MSNIWCSYKIYWTQTINRKKYIYRFYIKGVILFVSINNKLCFVLHPGAQMKSKQKMQPFNWHLKVATAWASLDCCHPSPACVCLTDDLPSPQRSESQRSKDVSARMPLTSWAWTNGGTVISPVCWTLRLIAAAVLSGLLSVLLSWPLIQI